MKGYKIVSFESLGTKSELLNFSDENQTFHAHEGAILAIYIYIYIFCKYNPNEIEYYQVWPSW